MKNIYQTLYRQSHKLKLHTSHPRLQAMLSLTLPLNIKNKKILDIGCNDGTFLTFFKQQTSKLYGLDASPQSVKRCHDKQIHAQQYYFDDHTSIPLASNSFDLIIAGEIIEHIYDTDYFLQEIRRLLKPNGYLLISTPNIASLGRRLLLLFGINPLLESSPNDKSSCGHIRYFTKQSLSDLLSKNKFDQKFLISDIINFDNYGKYKSKILAKLFPSLGQSIIGLYQKH